MECASSLAPGCWVWEPFVVQWLVMSDSLWPRGLQHARLPCPSPSPGVCSNSGLLSQWCHPTISSSVVPFSSCPQSFPALGLFQWVGSSHQVAKVLELQLQHQSFQWMFRIDFFSECVPYHPGFLSIISVTFVFTESVGCTVLSMNCRPPCSSVHGILQARILDWVAIAFSRGSSWHRDQTLVSCIEGRFFTFWGTSCYIVYDLLK